VKLEFFKMHAQGNDYIFFDLINKDLPDLDLSEMAIKLSSRHTGIGSDGIVLILPDPNHDTFMRIFNVDGSEADNCGSALRCITYHLFKKSGTRQVKINTRSGIKSGKVLDNEQVEIDLGEPEILESKLRIGNRSGYSANLGNPHYIVFLNDLPDNVELEEFSQNALLERFPKGINLEFAKIISTHKIKIKIWERGSGATLACGTGAGATVFAGLESGLLYSPVEVEMPGGTVTVTYSGKRLCLLGEVDFVFSGDVYF